MSRSQNYKDIDILLGKIFKEASPAAYFLLEELFEHRLNELNITRHQAMKILSIDHKTLGSFLSGESTKIDFVTILKLSDFLGISHDELILKYVELVGKTNQEEILQAKKRSFIVHNFNLALLKKAGLIKSIIDFDHIEQQILAFFGYDNIFEHKKHTINAMFSSGKRATKKESLNFWYATACESLERTPNPYEFSREALVNYFPKIRWHSMDIEHGLVEVAQALYKIGITLIIIPKYFSDLHLRGATLSYRDKPCIILTPYTTFYATLWFALIHELHHILFDWNEIRSSQIHISGETESMKISEQEADEFAREYLFSDEKMKVAEPRINDAEFIKRFAEQNHIHPSIIYSFYNFRVGKEGYKKFHTLTNPNFDNLLNQFKVNEFEKFSPIQKISSSRNLKLLSSL